ILTTSGPRAPCSPAKASREPPPNPAWAPAVSPAPRARQEGPGSGGRRRGLRLRSPAPWCRDTWSRARGAPDGAAQDGCRRRWDAWRVSRLRLRRAASAVLTAEFRFLAPSSRQHRPPGLPLPRSSVAPSDLIAGVHRPAQPRIWSEPGRLQARSLIAVGLGIAALGFAGRYAFQIWKPLGQVITETAKKISTPSFSSYYKGGFEQKMSRREASLILGISPSASKAKIRAAHRRIMILNHPDKGLLWVDLLT
uniref:DnaJ heat shock protein family (Hsp40) member C15 n=1 Tax=Capra hircus TaxID=9925 RepID=A0A8C2QUX0_CAPHI